MTTEPPRAPPPDYDRSRPQPASTVQVAGQAASDVVYGLQKNPMLLALVVLNIIGIGAGVWVLKDIGQISNTRFTELSELTKQCFAHIAAPKP